MSATRKRRQPATSAPAGDTDDPPREYDTVFGGQGDRDVEKRTFQQVVDRETSEFRRAMREGLELTSGGEIYPDVVVFDHDTVVAVLRPLPDGSMKVTRLD